MIHLDIIAGARPNFMKISPIIKAIHLHNTGQPDAAIQYRLIHTGQHYDRNMSQSFFEQLEIPEPHLNLGAGSGSQASQTAQIMTGYEKALEANMPDICLVVGDVTSTMACSIVAKKAGVKVAHVEGGIRSRDWAMPEEVNRIVTDSITDYFFTTSDEANRNLQSEGHAKEKIVFVGNTMIDSLFQQLPRIQQPAFFGQHIATNEPYLVLTLHRPSNVDVMETLAAVLATIEKYTAETKIIFPVHPRTRKMLDQLNPLPARFILVEPLPYLEFIYIVKHALGVITDSGGITEEASVLNIPCITLRTTTERPETVALGTNELIGNIHDAGPFIKNMIAGQWKQAQEIPMWDGNAATRIVAFIAQLKSGPK